MKIVGQNFLRSHPRMDSELNVPNDHVIVDKKDLDYLVDFFSNNKDITERLNTPKVITIDIDFEKAEALAQRLFNNGQVMVVGAGGYGSSGKTLRTLTHSIKAIIESDLNDATKELSKTIAQITNKAIPDFIVQVNKLTTPKKGFYDRIAKYPKNRKR